MTSIIGSGAILHTMRVRGVGSANTTLGYLEWRDTVAARDEDLLDALEKLTVPELYAANNRLIGGLAAERLNPTNSHGDFHLAAGMIRGLLYKAGHKFSAES